MGVLGAAEAQAPVLFDQVVQAHASSGGAAAEQPLGHLGGELPGHLAQLGEHAAALQRQGVDRAGGSMGHDEEDHGHAQPGLAQLGVQPRHGLEAQVEALVAGLETARGEKVEGAVEIERLAREEVAHRELVDRFLVLGVDGLEVGAQVVAVDVDPVGREEVGLAAQQPGALLGGDGRDRGEHVAGPGAGALQLVGGRDRVVGGGGVGVQVLQALVEVLLVGGGVASHLGGVGGERGGERNPVPAQERQRGRAQPLVEVGQDAPLHPARSRSRPPGACAGLPPALHPPSAPAAPGGVVPAPANARGGRGCPGRPGPPPPARASRWAAPARTRPPRGRARTAPPGSTGGASAPP
jgi:hypothetical protein